MYTLRYRVCQYTVYEAKIRKAADRGEGRSAKSGKGGGGRHQHRKLGNTPNAWERLEQPLRKGQAAHHAAGEARVPLHKGRHLGAHQLRVLRQEQHRLQGPAGV